MSGLAAPMAPVSWGELIDKLTILEIKRARIAAPEARANVAREHDLLAGIAGGAIGRVADQAEALRQVNLRLWEIEDAIRRHEGAGDFGDGFVALARSVYRENDRRAAIKRSINLALGSAIMEEKSYPAAD